mgnify:FL=1
MKKLIYILIGVSTLLGVTIYVIYQANTSVTEEVDIVKEDQEDKKELKKEPNNKVVVDIKGMVANPGVYEVDQTTRVNDVIALAGGLLEGADTSKINLAKIVEDEMTIIIYSKEEILEKYKEENCVCKPCEIINDACINNTDDTTSLININTATKEELKQIDGVGDTKAEAIIKYRNDNGPFKDIEELKNVSGIGEALFEQIKIYITI